jgi:trimeric autotransporter adhesin
MTGRQALGRSLGIPLRGLQLAAVAALAAFASGCSNWILGVVQSFGAPNGAKISTVAGNGAAGYAGDLGPATSAKLHFPSGVAVDSSGNLYIADTTNCVIRKVDTSGEITTVAGNFTAGFSGDNGLAAGAQLNQPYDVAVDSSGNIFISDTSNQVIRMVDHTTGKIATVAGNYLNGAGYSGDGGPATSAQLDSPEGIAVDSSGDLYIADFNNTVIRKLSGGTITTVAGDRSIGGGYSGDGNLAVNAQLNYPYDVAVDASGNIYIADTTNWAIRKVDHLSGKISTVATIASPIGLTVDAAGNVYVSGGDVVQKVDASGTVSVVAGNIHLGTGFSGDGNVATAALLNGPVGLVTDSSGNLFFADSGNNRVRRVGFAK